MVNMFFFGCLVNIQGNGSNHRAITFSNLSLSHIEFFKKPHVINLREKKKKKREKTGKNTKFIIIKQARGYLMQVRKLTAAFHEFLNTLASIFFRY